MSWKNWSAEELEKQVSCSRWSSKDPDTVIPEYVDVMESGTKSAMSTIPNMLDIEYGPGIKQKLDLYGTDLAEDSPILVFIHGGYWQFGSKDFSGGPALLCYKNGFRTVAFGYTIAPEGTIKGMQNELILAIEFLNYKYPQAKLMLMGHSAGGQLASHILHAPLEKKFYNNICGMILLSGVFDLCPLVPTYVNEPLKLNEEDAKSLSGLHNDFNPEIHQDEISIFVIVGELEAPYFQNMSNDYFQKLRKHFSSTEFLTSPNDDHFTYIQNLCHSDHSLCENCTTEKVLHYLINCVSAK